MRYCEAEPGPRPPSSSGFDQSVITFAGSKSYNDPSPWHSGQAPKAELKLKLLGSSFGTSKPQSGQAIEEENSCSSFSPLAEAEVWISTSPFAICSALATEASNRFSTPGFRTTLSITASIV